MRRSRSFQKMADAITNRRQEDAPLTYFDATNPNPFSNPTDERTSKLPPMLFLSGSGTLYSTDHIQPAFSTSEIGTIEEALLKFLLSQKSSPPPPPTDKPLFEVLSSPPTTSNFISELQNHPSPITQLNDPDSNITALASSNQAYGRFKDHAKHKPLDLSATPQYNILPEPLSLSRIIAITASTLPTLLEPTSLNGFQRLNVVHGELELLMNGSSRAITFDIHAKNGVLHIIDNVLIPPPPIMEVISQCSRRRWPSPDLARK
ncbi:hypothetical protein BDZ45DRAFT_723992 [Acephala macrosclerotiorum]|nr:hypothetical protein BDZ45DRAFT_723992 [Acephala macrosclerotiorum]